ncbi:hypothetical protein GW755_01555 [bacterium]|nr:hypothetical protein [bacterium]
MSKKSESSIILGFLLGFTSFFLYDTFNDEKKKLKFLKDLEKFKKSYSPHIIEFKRRLVSSKELDKSIKELDKILGSNLYNKIMNHSENKTVEVKEKNTTRSIKKFFGAQ